MTKQLLCLITASVIVVGLESSVAFAQPALLHGIDVPPVPANLEVPAGHSVFLKGFAVGTQNYICLPSGPSVAWRFVAPQATLFLTFRGDPFQQITTPLSEPERARWRAASDVAALARHERGYASGCCSRRVTRPMSSRRAIPWLLLEGGRLRGRSPWRPVCSRGRTYVQRLNTCGGVAPGTGCSLATNIGRIALVPYSTDYFFYRAEH